MQVAIIRAGDVRTTTTPTGVMTTLASPTLGGSAGLSLWRVAFPAGAAGPVHAFDSEQVWTVLSGAAVFTVDGWDHELAGGDTIVLPANATRQVRAESGAEFIVSGYGAAAVSAPGHPADGSTPAWIA